MHKRNILTPLTQKSYCHIILLTLFQIQMHCLPIQAKADHLYGNADNSCHLGAGHIHHVPLGSDVTSD